MRVWKSTPRYILLFLLLALVTGIGAAAIKDEGSRTVYSVLEKAFYLSSEDAIWISPGLHVQIINVTIPADRKPVVTFKLTDDSDQGLDKDGKLTPGTVGLGIILAYLPPAPAQGASQQYVDYSTRPQTSTITGVTAQQASTDSGGVYTYRGDGTYDYRFNTVLPSDYSRTVTHTLGIYASRDLAEFGLSRYVDNQIYNFVPNGSAVKTVRQVVVTDSCNRCHDPLSAHGETGREKVEICILCHTPQTVDPDTGNTVDMKVMIHKIHDGANLPSVQAGNPYQIIGRGGVADFSDVEFPQDIRNCRTCHNAPPDTNIAQPLQMNNWFLVANREACGSCHDNIDFASGQGHSAGNYPAPSDKFCTQCHFPQSDTEYDSSIINAHVDPIKSSQLRYPSIQILSVSTTGPGEKPSVKFRLTDKTGTVIKPSQMDRLSFNLAGPTSDIRWQVTETATSATFNEVEGTAVYNFTNAIPADASGSYEIEAEGRLVTNITGPGGKPTAQRDFIDNVIVPFGVTEAVPQARRVVVETARCEKCHEKLYFHGGNRNKVEACLICHNPTATDTSQRPASALPGESIDFKVMIHHIHTGEELSAPYSVWGRGSETSFNDIKFPGDRRDCLQCHAPDTYTVPLPASATEVTQPRAYWSPMRPTAAACLGCHDSIEAAAHAIINTATFGESCAVCHKESADFSVSHVHAR